jgi:hypothetical protein
VLWDTNRSAIPVHPRSLEVRDFTGAESESSRDETDEPRLEIIWLWECRTCFQEDLELAIGENVFVGVPSG